MAFKDMFCKITPKYKSFSWSHKETSLVGYFKAIIFYIASFQKCYV